MSDIDDIPDYLSAIGQAKYSTCMDIFNQLLTEFGGNNIIAQITAAGKTKLISDAMSETVKYGLVGDLWEVYKQVSLIQITPDMAPYITEDRRQNFKNRLLELMAQKL
jgi:hypothetical protein